MVATLTELANALGTDKGTVTKQGHGYTLIYEPLFAPYRDIPVDLLEVGLAIGGPEQGFSANRSVTAAPSLALWRSYFRRPRVVGFDISDFAAFETADFTFIRGDCGRAEDLERVVNFGRAYDIIIDDGSHASFHQHLTFIKLFPLLKPGGLYIIEDLTWQPREYEKALPKTPKMRDHLDRFLRNGSFDQIPSVPGYDDELESGIGSVLLFDTFTLWGYGNAYNRRFNHVREQIGYATKSVLARSVSKAFRRSIPNRMRQSLQLIAYDPREIKLAIIQKTAEPR